MAEKKLSGPEFRAENTPGRGQPLKAQTGSSVMGSSVGSQDWQLGVYGTQTQEGPARRADSPLTGPPRSSVPPRGTQRNNASSRAGGDSALAKSFTAAW